MILVAKIQKFFEESYKKEYQNFENGNEPGQSDLERFIGVY